jgi:hypothetical protein
MRDGFAVQDDFQRCKRQDGASAGMSLDLLGFFEIHHLSPGVSPTSNTSIGPLLTKPLPALTAASHEL